MKIKMKTPGRNGKDTFKAGAVIDVEAKEAKALIARGLAEAVGKDAKSKDDDGGGAENGTGGGAGSE